MIRSVLLILLATAFGMSAATQASERSATHSCTGCSSQTTRTRHSGVLKKLLSSRPVSTSSSWNHTHPKWRADRKVTGAACQK